MIWQKILGWGSKAAGVVLPYKIPILIGIGSALAVVVGVHLWHDHSVRKERDELVAKNALLLERNANALHTLQNNEQEYEECLAVNEANAIALSDQRERADKAVATISTLKALNERDAIDIVRETDDQRGRDEECRTVDDALPDWVLIGVFD